VDVTFAKLHLAYPVLVLLVFALLVGLMFHPINHSIVHYLPPFDLPPLRKRVHAFGAPVWISRGRPPPPPPPFVLLPPHPLLLSELHFSFIPFAPRYTRSSTTLSHVVSKPLCVLYNSF
jgi:hypothetical protein